MVKGYPYQAVIKCRERDVARTAGSFVSAYKLTFNDWRAGFYGSISLFSFKDKKHYNMFKLKCELDGFTVHDHIEDAQNAPVAQ